MLSQNLETLRSRSRDMVRKKSICSKTIMTYNSSNSIGTKRIYKTHNPKGKSMENLRERNVQEFWALKMDR
ncbi:hypothetical protein L2227_00020 [Wolbachia endosymbiont of Delia radicum]|nr:hypothetical protein L2227_00020 [Wolbachia endosymbiont of Delia radicum]